MGVAKKEIFSLEYVSLFKRLPEQIHLIFLYITFRIKYGKYLKFLKQYLQYKQHLPILKSLINYPQYNVSFSDG